MNFKIIFFITFIFSTLNVFGKDTWIHVVGIDPEMRSQNFTTMYMGAKEFQNLCESSPKKPDCALYLNSNLDLAAEPNVVKKLGLKEAIKPTKKNVLDFLRAKLKESKENDSIIFSLDNHGSLSNSTLKSCIYINENDDICEDDIAELLKSKPKGVKLVINANGCFSGTFADLSSKEVCIVTWADRRTMGASTQNDLWTRIRKQAPETLYDLLVPMLSKETRLSAAPILASQSILNDICRPIRSKYFNEKLINPKDFYIDERLGCYSDDSINNSMPRFRTLFTEVQSILFPLIAQLNCEMVGLTGEACNELKSLSALNENSKWVMKLLNEGKEIEKELKKIGDEQQEIRSSYGISALESVKNEKVKNKIKYLILFNTSEEDVFEEVNKTNSIFSIEERKQILDGYKTVQMQKKYLDNKYEEVIEELKNKHKETLNAYHSYFKSPSDSAWKIYQACFFNATDLEVIKNDNIDEVRSDAKYPRAPTQKDFEEAVSCEKSISLQ